MNLFITDDDPDDIQFLTEALDRQGFKGNILLFSDGDQLLGHLRAHPEELPNLILLDLNMPVKDGFQTLRELKAEEHLKPIPVVILTSSLRSADEKFCYQNGCADFQRKPITMSEYEKLVEMIGRF